MLKTLWAEFKAFAFKGNMIDLAVAVVIGAAFSNVIHALVDDIIMPAVSYVTTAASSATNAVEVVAAKTGETVGLAKPAATQPATMPATEPAVVVPPAPTPAPAPAAAKPKDENKPIEINFMVGRFKIGHFIAELLNFVIVAFAVFITMVKLLGSVMKRASGPVEPDAPTTRECPECLSIVPIKARKCAHCTSPLPPV